MIVLTLTGLGMLGVPPEYVGIIGAGLLILGPLGWGVARQTRGLGLRQPAHRPSGSTSTPAPAGPNGSPDRPAAERARDRPTPSGPPAHPPPEARSCDRLTPSGRK